LGENHQATDHRLIAIEGKTLRGSRDQEGGRSAIHMVSAWAVENKLSLGQVVVEEKSNEITAIPQLLRFLDVSGALITIDAMGCQREIADQIRQRGGDYVLAVKPNQPKLSEQVEEAIDQALEQDAEKVDEHMDADDLPLAVDRVGTVDALAAVADLEHGTLSRENAEVGHQM
jgi:predicted transposase YbfD/YdcC